jgi:predicted nucleic acid-binding protein
VNYIKKGYYLISVYLDTNILKFFSNNSVLTFEEKSSNLKWGDKVIENKIYELTNKNKNIEKSNDKKLLNDIKEIENIFDNKFLEFYMNLETKIESMRILNIVNNLNIKINDAKPPIVYSRILFSYKEENKKLQTDFLKNIDNQRFLDIQKVVGAYQGKREINENQLLDAWHLWCAEYNKCDYFLTMDYKLKRIIDNSRNFFIDVKVITPQKLLDNLNNK